MKHDISRMSDKEIANLSHRDVFAWVRTKKWSRVQFDKWVEELMVQCYGEGMEEVLENRQDEDDNDQHGFQ
jgi:hypothetical protein